MERTMSIEEKIKRAEEIYARRHEKDTRNTATLYLNGKEKKDIKLFKKLILQMIVCLLIYLIFYTIQNNNYIFSEDFINKAKEVLSYDTNFGEIYNNLKNGITGLFNQNEGNNNENEDNNNEADKNIGGSNEEIKPENRKQYRK